MITDTGAIAHWIRLYPPSCGPRFKSQASYLCFFHLLSNLSLCRGKDKNEQNRGQA